MANQNGEVSIRMPDPSAEPGGSRIGGNTFDAPEKTLNYFVRFIAFVERAGNALGTLAFTWATVVLLGGYPSQLNVPHFWCTTAVVFLEAIRMFSRSNNRFEYQLFFRSRGAFRPPSWNWVIVIECLSYVLVNVRECFPQAILVGAMLLLVIGWFLSIGDLKLICPKLHHAISLWSPLIAVLLLPTCLIRGQSARTRGQFVRIRRHQVLTVIVFITLIVVVFILTINKLQLSRMARLVNSRIGSRLLFGCQVTLILCLCALPVTLLPGALVFFIIFTVFGLVVALFSNLQIPIAVARVVLALLLLPILERDYDDQSDKPEKHNLVSSLKVFYGMVLGQGILYIIACLFEVFSFIICRLLVRHAGFSGQWGVESVNMYYTHSYEKSMKGSVLAPNYMNLTTFAMDSLDSDSRKKKLGGLRVLHSFIQRARSNTKLLSKLTISTKTVTTLINMLGWTNPDDATIRLFAAKIIVELASILRNIAIPGTVQLVSSLLDTDIPLNHRNASTQEVARHEERCWILKCWSCMVKWWSIPEEEPLTDQDLLPVLGMSILEKLAYCDPENCVEISRAMDLIPKIVWFAGCNNDMNFDETQHKILVHSSLKLLKRLSGTGGEIGIVLRQKISGYPFILSNLADILVDNRSSQELRKLTIHILKNLAMNGNASREIGSIRVFISKLMHFFVARDGMLSTDSTCSLRMVAGKALAMLTTESPDNCSAMLKEPEHEFIKDLTCMLHGDMYRHVAARILQNLCVHCPAELNNSDLRELSYSLPEVLERTIDGEGEKLQDLIGLCSLICSIIPIDFARALEHGHIERRFVEKLVDTLNANMKPVVQRPGMRRNANMKPTVQRPGIRRVIVEQAISMMESNSRYANYLRGCRMMEALSKVEETPSKAEKYRLLLGNVGLMEYGVPLSDLVARAKVLMNAHST